jgi:hypothetical protein
LKSLIEFELYFIITSSEACDDNLQVVVLVRDEESIALLDAALFFEPAVNSLLAINLDTSRALPIGSWHCFSFPLQLH